MTYLASQCLVSIIQFADHTQGLSEERNKSQLLSKSFDMMKYIGRHLSFHDRYLKLHNKIHCHLSIKMVADLIRALFCGRIAPNLKPESSRVLLADTTYDAYKDTLRDKPKTRGENIIKDDGAFSSSIKTQDRTNFIDRLKADDFKLLHIIERLSMIQQHIVLSVSYGRLVNDLLGYCYLARGLQIDEESTTMRGASTSYFGEIQYRLFAYSVNILV